jgi:anti-sigma-K factor RskA
VLGDPSAQRVKLGARTTLVVGRAGDAVLVASNLPAAGPGTTYEAWVISAGRPVAAGLVAGGHGTDVLRLTRQVRTGDVVAMTIERAGGAPQPTTAPIAHAQV